MRSQRVNAHSTSTIARRDYDAEATNTHHCRLTSHVRRTVLRITMSEFTAPHHTAVAQLTGSGAPFEVIDIPRGSYSVRAYRNAEPNLRSVMTPGRQFGGALFLEYLEQKWTFDQFFDAVDALAGYLQHKCGVQPGDRVAIAMRNCPEWLAAFVAIIECGGVAVPLNSWGKTQELQQALKDSAAGVVVCDSPRFNFIPFHYNFLKFYHFLQQYNCQF